MKKNQEMLFYVMAALKMYDDILLLLPGSNNGDKEQEYQKMITALGIERQVRLLGHRPDIEKYMQTSDLNVAASLREGLPTHIVESFGCGIPCVATGTRGQVDVVTDAENGFLVQRGDVKSMADRILWLYNDRTLYQSLAKNAYQSSFIYKKANTEGTHRYLSRNVARKGGPAMKNPIVSVVMSAYNAEDTVRNSVNSILTQTLADFEFLIADDCSTDNTYAILTELAAQDKRIRLFRNPENLGQAYTRNMLFWRAQADFIAVMDSDDQSEQERLTVQWTFMNAHPEYGYTATWFRKKNDKGALSPVIGPKKGEIQKEDYLFGMPFAHPTTMFRLDALKEVKGYWADPVTRFRGEDYDMLMRMCAAGIRGYLIPQSLLVYFEGSAALKCRKLRYRWSEAKLRYQNFSRLGLLPKAIPYIIKPLIVGLVPQSMLEVFRKRNLKKQNLSNTEQSSDVLN